MEESKKKVIPSFERKVTSFKAVNDESGMFLK